MPHMETLMRLRPYELPQPQYALWYDVGDVLGKMTQCLIANALCSRTYRLRADLLIDGEIEIIGKLAAKRGVVLRIE